MGHKALQCWNHCEVTQDRKEGVELAGRIGKNPDQINDLTYRIVRVEGHGPGGMQQPWCSLSGSPFFLFF